MTIEVSLLDAYLSTHFVVYEGDTTFTIMCGRQLPEFDTLLDSRGVKSAVIITAWNPWSRATGHRENECAQKKLEDTLRQAEFSYLPSSGVDPNGEWPAEPSFCVLGMSAQEAELWSKTYRQNAVVIYRAHGSAELLLTPVE